MSYNNETEPGYIPEGGVEYESDYKPLPLIEDYMTVKMRMILGGLYNKYGYPVKKYHYMSFYSGMSIWLPDEWVISPRGTRNMWEREPNTEWREVLIYHLPPTDMDALAQSEDLSEVAYSIVTILGKVMGTFFGLDPFGGSIASHTAKRWSVYPNIGFFNTLNDIVIKANLDYIKVDLLKAGYKANW